VAGVNIDETDLVLLAGPPCADRHSRSFAGARHDHRPRDVIRRSLREVHDELVTGPVEHAVDRDRVRAHGTEAVLMCNASGLSLLESGHSDNNYRRRRAAVPPKRTSPAVAVEGSPPLCGGWVTPRTAVGVDVGEATGAAYALDAGATGVLGATDPRSTDGTDPGPASRDPPALVSSAVPATSARSTAPATIGNAAIPLASGNRPKQRGQKPETGVVTRPQSGHLTGRRARAMRASGASTVRSRFWRRVPTRGDA